MEARCFAGAWSCVSGSDVKSESMHLRRKLCFSIALADYEFFENSVLPWFDFNLSLRVCLMIHSAIPFLGRFLFVLVASILIDELLLIFISFLFLFNRLDANPCYFRF